MRFKDSLMAFGSLSSLSFVWGVPADAETDKSLVFGLGWFNFPVSVFSSGACAKPSILVLRGSLGMLRAENSTLSGVEDEDTAA
ncbi:MAG TPA: hypothetical protein PLK30_14230 [Blastocatellia bacterium]|nr:hypothetical protein [Blastocatellia bacterium]